jgi:hypothetical protein
VNSTHTLTRFLCFDSGQLRTLRMVFTGAQDGRGDRTGAEPAQMKAGWSDLQPA